MKVVAIVQARMGSTRLPGKVMKKIDGVPMIGLLLSRLSQSKEVNRIIVATTKQDIDLPLVEYVKALGYKCVQGSKSDVLDRYLIAAKESKADIIVRITGDCPLVDPSIVDLVVKKYKQEKVDYCSNTNPPTYPDGLDVEVFSMAALVRASNEAIKSYDREHVTPYLRENKQFKTSSVNNHENLSNLRWTVDEMVDLRVVEGVFSYYHPSVHFNWKEVIKLERLKPEIFNQNRQLIRNEGAKMSSGQKLWRRAKEIIPGGNMLLSKRSEMFLPEQWPSYYSKSKGCTVWDMDGNKFTDMSIMGIGTNVLGYGNEEVDDAVRQTINAGNMSTLNCPEEVYLAEKLIEIHPWADMVRFARSGGEANAIAVRIARAASGKDKVAICGYHGWHDWYLSANLGSETSLSGHLLPGLEPNGVPKSLKDTVFPFNYNNFEELLKIVSEHDVGVIKMEVQRNHAPENDFLKKVRSLATEKGIVLIFDECTSGFRETFGGLHKKYGVEPDMAMFGKALGNGYAITATIGRREIMEAAQSTFISSTFWTERIGPTAALKTLEVMEKSKSWETIHKTGIEITARWKAIAEEKGLKITTNGLPSLTGFTFSSNKALEYKTFLTQEMLKKGYLAGTSVYVCTEHTPDILDKYFEKLDPIFKTIKNCEEGQEDIYKLIEGPVCHSGFKRLN